MLPSIVGGMSKKQIAHLAERSVEKVMEEGNVFLVAEALAAMEDFTKQVRHDDRFVQLLRDELVKNNGRMVSASGAKIESCEAGVHYDYSGNAEWRALDEEIRLLMQRKKLLEEKLRSISPGKMIVDHETGEVTEGAGKTSRSTYRITLARQ